MARTKGGPRAHKRHKKIISEAKGYRGRSKNCFRIARRRVERAKQYAYRDRRNKKRNFRSLWIQRINAAARDHGLTYSKFMYGIKLAGIEVDRKIMAELAMNDAEGFKAVFECAQEALKEQEKAA